MGKIIDNDDFFWEKQINEIFKNKKESEIDVFLQAVNLVIFSSIKNNEILELYKLVGLETFTKIINFFNGRNIKTIKVEEFREALMFAIYFYMINVEGKDWKEIKEDMPFEVESIKYGIRITKLNKVIQEQLAEIFGIEVSDIKGVKDNE